MWILVRQGEHVCSRLHQDLGSREVGRFLCEIGVTNRAFCFLQVGQRLVQADQVAIERRRLKRTESTSQARHLVDHFVDDLGGAVDVVGQASRLAAAEFVEPTGRSAESVRC